MLDVLQNYSTEAASKPASPPRAPTVGEVARFASFSPQIQFFNCTAGLEISHLQPIVDGATLSVNLICIGNGDWINTPSFGDISDLATFAVSAGMEKQKAAHDKAIDTATLAFARIKALTPPTSGWLGKLERIVQEVGCLSSGWDGPDSVAPSAKTVTDLDQALRELPSELPEPEVEVDSSDGSVTVSWNFVACNLHVAATFIGNGRVFVFFADQHGSRSESAKVRDDVRLQEIFDEAFSRANVSA